MRVIEYCLQLSQEQQAFAEELLAAHEFEHFYFEEKPRQKTVLLRLYYEEEQPPSELLLKDLYELYAREESSREVSEEEWLKPWVNSLSPFELIPNIIVCPNGVPEKREPDKAYLDLPPGTAFGTGLHETTQVAAILLSALDLEDKRVLDVGCGTGILGLIASIYGASCIFSTDNYFPAIKRAEMLYQKNNCKADYRFACCNLLDGLETPTRSYDLLIANIISEVLIELLHHPNLDDFCSPGKPMILSGIGIGKLDSVTRAVKKSGRKITDHIRLGNWTALLTE